MYTGCNKTAITSQNAIADTMVRLMSEKSYSSISISELCKEAGISRQTFYTLFSDKDNVIEYELVRKHGFDPDKTCTCSMADITLRELCESYSSYIVEKEAFLTLLIKNNMDSCIEMSLVRTLRSCNGFISRFDGRKGCYAAGFLAGGLVSVIRNYIEDEAKPNAAELSEIIYCLFSGELFRS